MRPQETPKANSASIRISCHQLYNEATDTRRRAHSHAILGCSEPLASLNIKKFPRGLNQLLNNLGTIAFFAKTKTSAWKGHLGAMEPTLGPKPGASVVRQKWEMKNRYKWHLPRALPISILLAWVPGGLLAPTLGPEPSNDEILERVAANNVKHYAVAFSVLREYKLRNRRFEKEAAVYVQVTYRPNEGMTYIISERSGSPKLIEIVEKLLASEADASAPTKLARHLISPANYAVYLRGTEVQAGRSCYIVDLEPKHKNKYLMKGTAWVDRGSYDIVRLEGATSASVSMWIGTPHIEIEFTQIDGLWLPVHTGAISSGLLLGTSELEIRYWDYFIITPDHPTPSRTADSIHQSRP